MSNVFLRALLHPMQYKGVFKKRTLILREIICESETIYSFIFTMPEPFVWNAGEHGILTFPSTHIIGKKWRAFSIASSSDENALRISTIITENPSDFKKHLLLLEQGSKMALHGPFGEFTLSKKTRRIVGIAGGIGITAFRALITDIISGKIQNTTLTLIYSAIGSYTFKEEFDLLLPHPSVEIIYTRTPEEVNKELNTQVTQHKNSAHYFISGSPRMIEALRTSLQSKGITQIINDSFKGY